MSRKVGVQNENGSPAGKASLIVAAHLEFNRERLYQYLEQGGEDTAYLDGKVEALTEALAKLQELNL
jgi:hypothetical protein